MSEGQYSDMILVDCNRLASEQSKGNTDNDGKSVWTNKLGSGIKLNQGDKVSIHSGFVSERGAGDSSMEFEGITQKQQYYLRAPTLKKFQYMNNPKDTRGTAYNRLNTDANGTPGKATCHYYEMEQQGPFDIKDNEINFKISYYKTTNGQGYFHLPRRFDAWKQNFNENSMTVINPTFSAGNPDNEYDPNWAILYNSEYYRNNNTHLFGQNADVNTAATAEKRGAWTDPFRPFTTTGATTGSAHNPLEEPQVFCLSSPNLSLKNPAGEVPTATTKGLNGWVNSPNMYIASTLQKVAGTTQAQENTVFTTFPQPMDDNWANGRTMNLWDDAIVNSLKPCKADLFWYNGYGQTSMSQLTLAERPQDVVDDSGDYFNSVETLATETPSTTGTAGPNASYRAAGWKGKNDNSKYTIFVKEISYFSQPSQVYDFDDIGPCGFNPNIKRIGNTDYGDSESVDNNTTSRHDYFPYYNPGRQAVDGSPLAIRDPAISEYIRYEEIKNLKVPEGYNTATNIADELTTQLNKTKTPEIIFGQVGGTFADSKLYEFQDTSAPAGGWYKTFVKANGDSNAPPKPISKPVSIKRESETYKSFPCATSVSFNSEHHSRFFMGDFGPGSSSICNEGDPNNDNPTYAAKNTNYLSSYATIGVKRPDLWEAGREITKNCGRRIISNGSQKADYVASQNGTSGWSWKQVIYPQLVSQIYPTGGGGAGDFTQLTAVVETDIEWNENNLKLIKKFLDIQGKYPELWDGVEYEVNMTSPNSIAKQGLSPDNSRYIHVDGGDHDADTNGSDNWKYPLGSDNYGESYIGEGTNNSENFFIGKGTSGTTEIRTHASMPLWFYYDKSRTDIADGGTSENDLYYGFAKKITYRDQYENETGSQVEEADGDYAAGLTTFNISSLGGIYKPDTLYTGEFISATIVGEEGSGWTTPINITNSVFVAGGQTLTIASGLPITLSVYTKLTVNFVRFKTREGIAFTTKKIGGLADYYFKSKQNGASGFGTGRRRTIGFDPHFSAYGSSAICLYSGLLSGQPSNDNFQDGRNSKLDKETSLINMSYRFKNNYLYQNPYVLEQPSRMRGNRTLAPTTLNNGGTPAGSYVPPAVAPAMNEYATNNGVYKNKSPIYQYIRERYVGATNPQLSFDTASSRFNFQSLHTPERVGGSGSLGATTSAWDIEQDPANAAKDELITLDQTSVPADINNDVYYVNKRFTNRNDFCPDLFPYEQPILCAYYNEQKDMVVAAVGQTPEDTANLVKQTYTPLNGAVSPFSIMDADGGIFIEDFGLSWDGSIDATDTDKRNYQKKNWDKSLWSVLGFTWEQFHSQTTLSRQNRINSISTNTSLGALTTNAEVSQADLSKFSSNLFGVPYNTSQLPITQNPMIEESSLVEEASGTANPAQSKSYQFTTTAPTDYYPIVNQSSKSVEISAVNLPRKMINPYYLVKSDIVSDLKYYGGDDSGISLPIVYVVNKENGFGDFFFQSQGQQEFTITKATTLSSITTSIHLPNMRTPLLNEGSSIIYKIVKQNQSQLGVAEQILQEQMKKQKSKKK